MMAAVGVDLNVNATYSQHPALKSVYGNIQPVIGGKLFSFHCIGKCLNCTGSSRLDYSRKNPNRAGEGDHIEFPGEFIK